MAKVKVDVSKVDDLPDFKQLPVGTYRAKIESCELGESKSSGSPMLTVVLKATHDAKGKKLKEAYSNLWYYLVLEHESPFVQARLKEFLKAAGQKLKGTLDTDDFVGQTLLVKVKEDKDLEGDYRAAVSKVMTLADSDEDDDEGEAEPEDGEADDADESGDESEDDDESEDEDDDEDDEEEIDLDELDRKALKQFIKGEDLDITVKMSMSDGDIREAIESALSEDEDDDEDDDEADDDDNYDQLTLKDLKAKASDRELDLDEIIEGKVTEAKLIEVLRKDDRQPF